MDVVGISGVVQGLIALTGGQKITGRAITVDLARGVGSKTHLGAAAIDHSGPGDVIVIANHARIDVAGWGGVLSAGADRAGVEGVIVDGAVRDVDESAELGLPIYARAAVPITARGRVVERAWNVPVLIANVHIKPGDIVVADRTGVVAIPWSSAEHVLEVASGIAARERDLIDRVLNGDRMVDIMGTDYEGMLLNERS